MNARTATMRACGDRKGRNAMKIRKFEESDAEQVISLVSNVLRDEFHREASAFPMHDLKDIGAGYGGERETFLVAERDDPALTAALRDLTGNRQRRLAMGRTAREFIESRFDFETQVAEHLSIYRRLISGHASHPEGTRPVSVPEDYVALMEKTLRIGEAEFSLAELAARALRAPSARISVTRFRCA